MQRFYTLLLSGILVLLLSNAAATQNPVNTLFQTNNVRAVVNANGSLFTDFQQGQFIPLQPGLVEKTLLRRSGIWMAGIDPAGNLQGAMHVGSQSDFQPGGMNDNTNQPYDLNYIWRVGCSDVNTHLADFQDNGQIDQPNPAVFGWPGMNNPYSEQYTGYELPFSVQALAGYRDADDNASYNPTEGEYPAIEIRGCPLDRYPTDMSWSISNDAQPHPSGLKPLQMEVQTQAFAYQALPTANLLNNTIFVRYKLINRGYEPVDSCYFGLYTDFNIGNGTDDFTGSDPSRNLIYAYNGDTDDEDGFGASAPVMVVDLLRGPLDNTGQELDLRHFVVLENVTGLQDVQFYNVLTGHFPDGSPAPDNGLMYPGNPNDPAQMSEVSAGNAPGHRVGVASFGPFTLQPGAVNELIVAYYYVYTPGFTPLQNVQSLYEELSATPQQAIDNCFADLPCLIENTSAGELAVVGTLYLYPSPATHSFTVENKEQAFDRIEIVDMLGRLVRRIELDQTTQKHTVLTSDWPAGWYTVRVGGQLRPVVVQR